MTSNEKTGGNAFPNRCCDNPGYFVVTPELEAGATWLDVCAWHALQGLLADSEFGAEPEEGASIAYNFAVAMLAEKRRREQEGGA